MSNLVKDCKSYLQVGDEVETSEVDGIVGEIAEKRFYVWQNKQNGSVGSLRPSSRGLKYSWAISFDHDYTTIKVLNRSIISHKQDKKMSLLQKLTSSLRRIFPSKAMRTQYRAGFIGGCGELTTLGREELESINRDANEEALTKLAQERIDEIKKEER